MAHFHCTGQKLLLIEELLQFMNSVERVQSREREREGVEKQVHNSQRTRERSLFQAPSSDPFFVGGRAAQNDTQEEWVELDRRISPDPGQERAAADFSASFHSVEPLIFVWEPSVCLSLKRFWKKIKKRLVAMREYINIQHTYFSL